jgi:hypothetical protein
VYKRQTARRSVYDPASDTPNGGVITARAAATRNTRWFS